MTAFRQLLRRQDGATAIEYALIAGLLSLMIISGATLIGGNLNTTFTNVSSGFN